MVMGSILRQGSIKTKIKLTWASKLANTKMGTREDILGFSQHNTDYITHQFLIGLLEIWTVAPHAEKI